MSSRTSCNSLVSSNDVDVKYTYHCCYQRTNLISRRFPWLPVPWAEFAGRPRARWTSIWRCASQIRTQWWGESRLIFCCMMFNCSVSSRFASISLPDLMYEVDILYAVCIPRVLNFRNDKRTNRKQLETRILFNFQILALASRRNGHPATPTDRPESIPVQLNVVKCSHWSIMHN